MWFSVECYDFVTVGWKEQQKLEFPVNEESDPTGKIHPNLVEPFRGVPYTREQEKILSRPFSMENVL